MHSESTMSGMLYQLATTLSPIDLSVPIVNNGVEKEYFRYYGINFEENIKNVEHYFGSVSSAKYEISTHFFRNIHARETCFVLHGYYDHSGLYQHVINYCLRKNYSVVIFDLPGHGLSSGTQASIGDFLDYQQVLADILRRFESDAPKPWHAIAQSTGGAILSEFLLSSNVKVFNKTAFLAPLIYPVRWRSSLLTFNISKYFIKKTPRIYAENSNDQQFLEFLKTDDPLQADHLPLEWVGALGKWIERFLDFPKSNEAPLIIQGEDDGTVDWKRNMPIFKQKFPDCQIHTIAGAKHQLVNESEEIRSEIFLAIDKLFSQA